MLHDIPKRKEGSVFCGPAAIIAATGHDYDTIKHAINDLRGRRPGAAVKGMYNSEVCDTLHHFRCHTLWHKKYSRPYPTLAKFLRERTEYEYKRKFLINVTGHYVTVEKDLFVDNHTKEVVLIDEAPHRRCKVQRVWEVRSFS